MSQLTRRRFNQTLGLSLFAGGLLPSRSWAAGKTTTLRAVVQTEPTSLADLQQNSATSGVGARVLEGLLHIDFDMQPQPYLAISWKISDDGLEYRFNLRDGVKWHDGKPFSSADVAYSILTLKEIHPRRRATFANVTRIDTPDPLTVVVHLSKPAPYLLGALSSYGTPIIPRHLYEGTDPASNPYNTKPIGTGPYIFKEWVRGSHYLLERNPAYWDQGKPQIDRIVVRFITDVNARAAAFESGELDIGGQTPVSFSDIERFTKDKRFQVETRGAELAGNIQQVFLNLENPYLKDLKVRQAIAHSIDIGDFIKTVWFGYAIPAATAIAPSMAQFHDPSIKHYSFDLALAEKLLDEAGYSRKADGTRFSLRMLHNTINSRLLPSAEYLRAALGRVGIKVEIQSYDFATYVQKIYTERAYDLDVQTLVNGYDPTDGIQRAYWSKNIKRGLPWSNQTNYVNAEVDDLFERASVEPDEAKRRELYVRLQQVLHADLPAINLVQFQALTLYRSGIRNPINDATGILGNYADTAFS